MRPENRLFLKKGGPIWPTHSLNLWIWGSAGAAIFPTSRTLEISPGTRACLTQGCRQYAQGKLPQTTTITIIIYILIIIIIIIIIITNITITNMFLRSFRDLKRCSKAYHLGKRCSNQKIPKQKSNN